MAQKRARTTNVYSVIMAGGSGTRFWPLSRLKRPKQFLALVTSRTMLTETLMRVANIAPARNTFIVCGAEHSKTIKKNLKIPKQVNILVEPQARNTAPAIALATAHIARLDPQGIVVALPADHHVAQQDTFTRSLNQAIEVATRGNIVVLGIQPTRPETGYGYIRLAHPFGNTAYHVAAFVEKPDLATAQQYVASQKHLWNAGIFIFRANVMLDAFAQHMPEVTAPLAAIRKAIGTRNYKAVVVREFKKMPAISIDYGVAEKAAHIAVVQTNCGWSDVGSFNALAEVRQTDAVGNVAQGQSLFLIDSKNCTILAGKRPVAVVGLRDVVVVDAEDAVLVVQKNSCQDVRKVVEKLHTKRLKQYL